MITILGSLLGFLGALFPDLIKMFKDSQDRKHELTVMQMQMQQQKEGHSNRMEEIGAQADISLSQALYKTWKTGVEWVDALNGTVRPVLAYGFFVLYAAIKVMVWMNLPDNIPLSGQQDLLWNGEDQAIFAAIISFYYGSRQAQRVRGK